MGILRSTCTQGDTSSMMRTREAPRWKAQYAAKMPTGPAPLRIDTQRTAQHLESPCTFESPTHLRRSGYTARRQELARAWLVPSGQMLQLMLPAA